MPIDQILTESAGNIPKALYPQAIAESEVIIPDGMIGSPGCQMMTKRTNPALPCLEVPDRSTRLENDLPAVLQQPPAKLGLKTVGDPNIALVEATNSQGLIPPYG